MTDFYLGSHKLDATDYVYYQGNLVSGVYFRGRQLWAQTVFHPHVVTVDTPGSFSVPWPLGANRVNVVIASAGSGGASVGGAGDPGGDTTVTVESTTLTAVGGPSPGVSTSDRAATFGEPLSAGYGYPGGSGGDPALVDTDTNTVVSYATDATAPGAGGGGIWGGPAPTGPPGTGSYGGKAGEWEHAPRINKASGAPITGTVGDGGSPGQGGVSQGITVPDAGAGSRGVLYLYFFRQQVPFSVSSASNDPVPAGAAGCWVTLIGRGGHGGRGYQATFGDRIGGAGGGGGAHIPRTFIPIAYLGQTYSLSGGYFTSGNVTLYAYGGLDGEDGSNSGFPQGGAGGTAYAAGVDVDKYNGTDGGNGGFYGSRGKDGSPPSNSGATGGGGGGGANSLGGIGNGGNGGRMGTTAPGGTRGDLGTANGDGGDGVSLGPGKPGTGGGGGSVETNYRSGAGGDGGYNGGGGGGSSAGNIDVEDPGIGGSSYSLVEWV